MYPGASYMGDSDGTKMQAKMWSEELISRGHSVQYINPWNGYDWSKFDIIHVFGFGLWNYDLIHWGSRLNSNFVFSPIIDSNTPIWKYKLATYFGCSKLRLYSQNYMLRCLKSDIKHFYARSKYEMLYLTEGYGIEEKNISLVPLSYRSELYDYTIKKRPFCLFIGTMTQERKNVNRLIMAAKKYNFNLKLVGNIGNNESSQRIRNLIRQSDNIDILGYVSDEELNRLYDEAKVFALPSLNEGVGLAALEAAMHNCNIVITNLGGPKEYYEDKAYLVNPYDIDDIGNSILNALKDDCQQPFLMNHIKNNYNLKVCIDKLESSYSIIADKWKEER